jgi:hypothetical protein
VSNANGYELGRDVQLPLPVAIWVLGAHAYALFVPVILLLAIAHHPEVAGAVDYPLMLYVAIGLMMAGSAFEIAQNAIDKWYLTPETGSAEGTGFCDFLFYWLIIASQAAIAIACVGSQSWVVALGVLGVLIFPVLYFRQTAQFAPLAVLGLLATVAAWWRFGDPVIFLQLLLTPLTMYFFGCLLKTGAQVLHGCTTAAASSGVLFVAWGIHGAATGQPQSWLTIALIAGVTGLVAIVLRPQLLRLSPTPRPAVS